MVDTKKAEQIIRIKIQNCLDVCSNCRKDKKECTKCDIQEQLELHRIELLAKKSKPVEETLREEIASLKGKLAAEKQQLSIKEKAWKKREAYLISEHKEEVERLKKINKKQADKELQDEIKELRKIEKKYNKILKTMKELGISL